MTDSYQGQYDKIVVQFVRRPPNPYGPEPKKDCQYRENRKDEHENNLLLVVRVVDDSSGWVGHPQAQLLWY